LGIGLFKSVLMYSNGTICLIKLLFKMGLFTVYSLPVSRLFPFRLWSKDCPWNLFELFLTFSDIFY
jgi:hypothetical protein